MAEHRFYCVQISNLFLCAFGHPWFVCRVIQVIQGLKKDLTRKDTTEVERNAIEKGEKSVTESERNAITGIALHIIVDHIRNLFYIFLLLLNFALLIRDKHGVAIEAKRERLDYGIDEMRHRDDPTFRSHREVKALFTLFLNNAH